MAGAADSFDVVIIGGGPAGSVAATLLADAGHRVAVFERERFPRYHIGESLLSATLPILDAIGATPLIERHGFLRKPGGTFLWGRQEEPWSFWFREDPGGRPYAYQVVRAEFDMILLDNARAHGAAVHEEHSVTAIGDDGGLPVVDVCAADGATRRQAFRLVVLPQVRVGLIAVAVFAFIRAWEEYIFVRTMLIENKNWVMSLYLFWVSDDIMGVDYGIVAAVCVFYVLPSLLLYVFCQKYLTQMTIGGIRG